MTGFFDTRRVFLKSIFSEVVRFSDNGTPSFADGNSPVSSNIARELARLTGAGNSLEKLSGQTSGKEFEVLVMEFVEQCFSQLHHLRPGQWNIQRIGSRDRLSIAKFEQYAHLSALSDAMKQYPLLATVLGNDYTITPDIVVFRAPEPDEIINSKGALVDGNCTLHAPLRLKNNSSPLLHASISCKWTIRSDRSQNSRTEALNLIRNRKGHLPHIAVVTAEPLPSRIASIALGTGDIDCVYHFALYELIEAVKNTGYEDAGELLNTMVEGRRLRDISDLPLDLAC